VFLIRLLLLSLLVTAFSYSSASSRCVGKTLCVAVPTKPPSLGNPYASLPIGAINPMHVLYDALTSIGDKGEILPALALEWEPLGNNAWIFRLRDDISFSNGELFNAQTVVDVITYLRSKDATGYPVANETGMIKSAEFLDDFLVKINTNRPDAILPKRMSFVYMVPMRYWKKAGVDAFGINPSGSGPFKLKDWGQASGTYIFERNFDSWRESNYFEEIHFTSVGDVVSRAQSMISGQIDLSFKLSLDLLKDLKAQGFNTLARSTYSVGVWAFRQIDPNSPLADKRVRRALNLAVDRETISRTILSGVSSPVSQLATEDVFGYNDKLEDFPYDPEGAKILLKQAGYEDGLSLKAIVRSDPSVPESILINQVVAQDLSKVGVKIKFQAIPGTRWLGMYFSGDWDGADILETSFNNTIHGDVIRSIETASCLKPGAFFCDRTMLGFIEESNREFDVIARGLKLKQIVSKLHYDPPGLYLFPYFDTIAYSKRLDTLPIQGSRVNMELIKVVK